MRLLCRVPSLTTRGRFYDIRQFPDGPGCECRAFEFSPPAARTCKHLAIYEAALHATKRCERAGHVPVADGEVADEPMLCIECLVDVLAAAAMKVRAKYVPAEKLGEVKAQAAAKVVALRARVKKRKARKHVAQS